MRVLLATLLALLVFAAPAQAKLSSSPYQCYVADIHVGGWYGHWVPAVICYAKGHRTIVVRLPA